MNKEEIGMSMDVRRNHILNKIINSNVVNRSDISLVMDVSISTPYCLNKDSLRDMYIRCNNKITLNHNNEELIFILKDDKTNVVEIFLVELDIDYHKYKTINNCKMIDYSAYVDSSVKLKLRDKYWL